MKSGTTSLHRYLVTHPRIFLTQEPKEPSYFIEREQLLDVLPGVERRGFWRSEDAYLKLFEGAEGYPVVGEASANYARLNRVTGVAERVAEFARDARVLFIARDPIERTISHYWYMVRFFEERRDVLTAISEDPDYRDTSHYAMQLKPWLKLFPAERVKVITTESLRDKPCETMADVFGWLQVDANFIPPNLAERANEAPAVIQQVRGAGLMHRFRHSALWNAVGPLVPSDMRKFARRFSEKSTPRDSVDTRPVAAMLRELQRDQTEELSALLGRRFPEWTALYADE